LTDISIFTWLPCEALNFLGFPDVEPEASQTRRNSLKGMLRVSSEIVNSSSFSLGLRTIGQKYSLGQ